MDIESCTIDELRDLATPRDFPYMERLYFGMDPVDFNHRDEHVKVFRSVSKFTVFPYGSRKGFVFCCSWKYDLLVRRFLNLFEFSYTWDNIIINSKLSRFSLQRIYDKLISEFRTSIDDRFDKIDWNSITEDGIIKFRKCKKRKS